MIEIQVIELLLVVLTVITASGFASVTRNQRLERRLMIDFARVNAAEADLFARVEKKLADMAAKIAELSAQVTDPAVQAQLDKLAAELTAEADKVDPPAPVAAPAAPEAPAAS